MDEQKTKLTRLIDRTSIESQISCYFYIFAMYTVTEPLPTPQNTWTWYHVNLLGRVQNQVHTLFEAAVVCASARSAPQPRQAVLNSTSQILWRSRRIKIFTARISAYSVLEWYSLESGPSGSSYSTLLALSMNQAGVWVLGRRKAANPLCGESHCP